MPRRLQAQYRSWMLVDGTSLRCPKPHWQASLPPR